MHWSDTLPISITVCDREGVILEMNEKACEVFAKDGGRALVGTNVLDCHPEPSRTKLAGMLRTGEPNVYTIEKGGIRKLIYQTPWFEDKVFRGFVELSLEIPWDIPHFVRS